jgi:hypothetical protein
MSSPASTLGSWIGIPLEAWMCVYVYSVFLFSIAGSGLRQGWYPVQGVLTVYNSEWKQTRQPNPSNHHHHPSGGVCVRARARARVCVCVCVWGGGVYIRNDSCRRFLGLWMPPARWNLCTCSYFFSLGNFWAKQFILAITRRVLMAVERIDRNRIYRSICWRKPHPSPSRSSVRSASHSTLYKLESSVSPPPCWMRGRMFLLQSFCVSFN